MKSFLTIMDTSTSSSHSQLSPRSSMADIRQRTPPPEQPTITSLSPPRELTSGAPTLGVPLQEASSLSPELSSEIWIKAWQTLHSIGVECVCNKLPTDEAMRTAVKQQDMNAFSNSLPSQTFLVHFLRIFPLVFSKLKPNFSKSDFQSVARMYRASLLMPVTKDVSPFLVPSSNENIMSAVHRLILKCLGVIFTDDPLFEGGREQQGREGEGGGRLTEASLLLDKTAVIRELGAELRIGTHPQLVSLYPLVVDELLQCASLAFNPPDSVWLPCKVSNSSKSPTVLMGVNLVPFGLGAVTIAVQLYRACVSEQVELMEDIPLKFLKVHPTT